MHDNAKITYYSYVLKMNCRENTVYINIKLGQQSQVSSRLRDQPPQIICIKTGSKGVTVAKPNCTKLKVADLVKESKHVVWPGAVL